MKIGIFFQMWHENQKAAYDSLKQLRVIYPDTEIALLVTGVYRANLEEYENNFLNIIKKDFNINKISHLHKDEYIGYFDSRRTLEDLLYYNDTLLEKTFFMLDESTDYVLFCSEDLYVFKEIPINPECDVCCNLRPWDDWMDVRIKEKLNCNKDFKIPWFQHGHYLNLNKFKNKFTLENRELVNNTIRELYPDATFIYSDYFTSLWCLLACDTFCSASNYLLELASEDTNETPLETFNRTKCYARHGYKTLYKQPL